MLRIADLDPVDLRTFLDRYGLVAERVADGEPITASFWGEPEAGIVGGCVFVRGDTPVHSMLHEACHVICMTPARRRKLQCNAGGDELEEAAVCYLQIVLSDYLPGVGRERLMRDMDAWGYSFRLGSAARWFREDAGDAVAWLRAERLLDANGMPRFRLRGA